MNSEKSTLTEFLAESNKILSTSDLGGLLYDLLVPIRSYLQKQEDLLTFSLCRLFGGSTDISFMIEWQIQTSFLTHSSGDLFEENRLFWRKKVPVKLRGVPGLFDKIDQDINSFLPKQLNFLQEKNRELQQNIIEKYPELAKYLSSSYFTKITASQFGKSQLLYQPEINLSQFLEFLANGSSYLKIGLPILLALRSTASLSGVKKHLENDINWLFIEEILKDLSCLYQISNSLDLGKFLYLQDLPDSMSFEWWQKNESTAFQILLGQKDIQNQIQDYQEKYKSKLKNDIARSGLGTQNQNLLLSLVDWAANG